MYNSNIKVPLIAYEYSYVSRASKDAHVQACELRGNAAEWPEDAAPAAIHPSLSLSLSLSFHLITLHSHARSLSPTESNLRGES